MALGRFLGKLKGVDSIEAEEGKIVINFDDKKISEAEIARIAKETLDKIGHF
jgi:hypothetical protein